MLTNDTEKAKKSAAAAAKKKEEAAAAQAKAESETKEAVRQLSEMSKENAGLKKQLKAAEEKIEQLTAELAKTAK